MFGMFMVNPEKEVCFAQFGEDPSDVAKIDVRMGNLAFFTLENGDEEMITEELAPEILSAIQSHDKILVAHINTETGDPDKEYYAAFKMQ